jgi:hypothetical protein
VLRSLAPGFCASLTVCTYSFHGDPGTLFSSTWSLHLTWVTCPLPLALGTTGSPSSASPVLCSLSPGFRASLWRPGPCRLPPAQGVHYLRVGMLPRPQPGLDVSLGTISSSIPPAVPHHSCSIHSPRANPLPHSSQFFSPSSRTWISFLVMCLELIFPRTF